MKRNLYILLLVFCSFATTVAGQKLKPQDQEYFTEAEYLFSEGYFLRALPLYLTLVNAYPEDMDFKYKLGICYLYKTDEPEKAIAYLEEVKKKNPGTQAIDFYLGRAYKLNYRLDEALASFNLYMQEKIKDNEKEETQRMIDQTNYTKKAVDNRIDALIRNLGSPVNSEHSEYVPVISADEAVLIFTYRGERSKGGLQAENFTPDPNGEYYEDIFISYKIGETWTTPESIGDNINTVKHDADIALSADGQTLFIYKSDVKNKGDIYISRLEGEVWTTPVPLDENINSSSWEGSCSLSADGTTLYFSSERPGGIGGRDIYVSKIQPDGKWGKAINLGPTINTKLDDDGPFIHPDGISLYFSSKGQAENMGGYDIFFSILREDGTWSTPLNFGYPVNTVGDDRYYVLTADGQRGYYSSGAPGGFGQQDIYTVTPGVSGIKPILALIKGVVSADGKPMEAKITVYNDKGEKQSTITSNAKTGKYLLALTPGKDYKLAFEIDGYEPMVQYVNTKTLDKYVEVIKDFHLYSKAYEGDKIIDAQDDIQKLIAEEQEKAAKESSEIAREDKVFKQIIQKYGEERIDSIQYTVQLAAVKDPLEYKTDLSQVGPVTKAKGPDGVTRITAGPFKTLLEAEAFRAKAMTVDTTIKSTSFVKANDKQLREFYAQEYKKENLPTEPKQEKLLNDVVNPPVAQGGKQTPKVISDKYKKILTELGNKEIEGVYYKLEIASVQKEEDFKYDYLKEFAQIEKKVYPDGTIRYTIGQFKTLIDAELFKQEVIKKYPEMAESFVTVFALGKRKTVEEFAEEAPKETKETPKEITKEVPPPKAEPCDGQPLVDFSEFDGKDLNDTTYYNALVRKSDVTKCIEGLTFKVQIGAYRKPKNFKYNHLNNFGKAKIQDYPDGITRFTMKEFKTLAEAEKFRQQVIKKGTKDAWVTGWYNNERKLLQDLIKENFYQKRPS